MCVHQQFTELFPAHSYRTTPVKHEHHPKSRMEEKHCTDLSGSTSQLSTWSGVVCYVMKHHTILHFWSAVLCKMWIKNAATRKCKQDIKPGYLVNVVFTSRTPLISSDFANYWRYSYFHNHWSISWKILQIHNVSIAQCFFYSLKHYKLHLPLPLLEQGFPML